MAHRRALAFIGSKIVACLGHSVRVWHLNREIPGKSAVLPAEPSTRVRENPSRIESRSRQQSFRFLPLMTKMMNKAHYCAALAQLARRVCVGINLCVFGALDVTSACMRYAGGAHVMAPLRARQPPAGARENHHCPSMIFICLVDPGFESHTMAARAPPHTANHAWLP